MALTLKVKQALRPVIEAAAKKLENGLLSTNENITNQIRIDGYKKYSDSTIFETIAFTRAANGINLKRAGFTNNLSDEAYLERQKEISASQKENRTAKDREKYLLSEIQRLEKLLEAAGHISKTPQVYQIKKQKAKFSQSTPVIFASDWHYEEEVKSETVSGLNEFNLVIADQRIDNFIKNSTRLLELNSKGTEIRDVIFCLGGDFISGDIHRDVVESCQLSPTEAIWRVQNHIASCLEYYLKETDFNFIIPCHSGNHGRTTKEQLIANESGHSLEWLMYQNLQRWFSKEKRLKFMIADGYHLYIDIDGFVTRTHHGHAINYSGGVGGFTIPANKAIAQWNKGKWAHHDFHGHLHSYFPAGNFNCNGSLIGFNPFAIRIKAGYEKPAQTFALINHEEKMISINAKIFL